MCGANRTNGAFHFAPSTNSMAALNSRFDLSAGRNTLSGITPPDEERANGIDGAGAPMNAGGARDAGGDRHVRDGGVMKRPPHVS